MQQFTLYLPSQYKLEIDSGLKEDQIQIHDPNASIQPILGHPNAN
jgi:hypothetical protein